jgi:hypothetical protein
MHVLKSFSLFPFANPRERDYRCGVFCIEIEKTQAWKINPQQSTLRYLHASATLASS